MNVLASVFVKLIVKNGDDFEYRLVWNKYHNGWIGEELPIFPGKVIANELYINNVFIRKRIFDKPITPSLADQYLLLPEDI